MESQQQKQKRSFLVLDLVFANYNVTVNNHIKNLKK